MKHMEDRPLPSADEDLSPIVFYYFDLNGSDAFCELLEALTLELEAFWLEEEAFCELELTAWPPQVPTVS